MNGIARKKLNNQSKQTDILLHEPLIFDSTDYGESYDFNDVEIHIDERMDAAVIIDGAKNLTIKGLRIQGCGKVGIMIRNAHDTKLLDCFLNEFECGIVTENGYGVLIDGNCIANCTVAVSIGSSGTVVRKNKIYNGKIGVSAVFQDSEISAAMSSGYNLLVAQNDIDVCLCSLTFSGVSNGVVLLNQFETVEISRCTNIYVAENDVRVSLVLKDNNYLLVNGNRVKELVNQKNQNVNGDNVTDINARADVGVNEELLPHINTEQFVGMKNRLSVLSRSEHIESLADYINREAREAEIIILPPDSYLFEDELRFEGYENKTIYAYGVIRKMTYSDKTAVVFHDSVHTTIKGIFVASEHYPHIQGTVVECGDQTYSFLADPGYLENFSDESFFGKGAPGGIFRPGETSPCSESYYKTRTYDPVTGINRIEGSNFKECKVGYRVAHRNWKGAGGICFLNCSEMLLEDVTVFCSSGFAEFDKNNEIAPCLHRYAVHKGPAPILDTKDGFSRWEGMELISTDCYGRLRGPEPMNSTCDATHSTNARRGMVMISCIMERMNDDGGNINAYYGTPISFDNETKTLIYTHCKMYFDRTGAKCTPVPFLKGDVLFMYGKNGKLIEKTAAICDGERLENDLFSVRLEKTISLPEDLNFAVIQNSTASGTGFLWDNVMVRDSLSFGIRLQANAGCVRNCTFRNTAKGGIHAVPQYGYWPECGYISDVTIKNNLFEKNSKMSGTFSSWSDGGLWLPLSIYTGDDLNHREGRSDAEYCLHTNILIKGNVFDSRYTRYAVYLSDVSKLTIKNNRFLPRFGMSSENDTQTPIWIAGGNDICLCQNTFPHLVSSPYRIDEKAVVGVQYTP